MTRVQTKNGQPAVYNATAPTLTDGDGAALNVDASGNLLTSANTLTAGEDLAINRQLVAPKYVAVNTTADTLIQTGAGILHSLTFSCNDAAPTAGSIIVYDNTAESGTIIYSETFDTTAFRGHSVIIDGAFGLGVYVGFTTTADVNCVVAVI